jgi:AcrR family transcriptional regulator
MAPKVVDREHRRDEIAGAAMRILARGGPGALTLRSLAEELNGSISMITHFFADRADLFGAIVDDLLTGYNLEDDGQDLEDPYEALRAVMIWYIPTNPGKDEREAGRVVLNGLRQESKSVDHLYVAMEERARAVYAHVLRRIVPKDLLPAAIDMIRATTNGIALGVVEHPNHWTLARRIQVVDMAVAGLRVYASSHDTGTPGQAN